MVRQGQIGEIIAAKPQERRRILEEAAGIAGLHSRRHEAELRLKAAEDNLTRLDDILQQIDTQTESFKNKRARRSATAALPPISAATVPCSPLFINGGGKGASSGRAQARSRSSRRRGENRGAGRDRQAAGDRRA